MARRRLAQLSAELAAIRPDPGDEPPSHPGRDGSGEPPSSGVPPASRLRPGRHAARPVDSAASVGGWVHDRLPGPLQGRVRLGAPHLAALAMLVAGVMTALAWSSVRASDPGDLVPARSLSTPGGAASLVTPAAVPVGDASPTPPGSPGSPASPAQVVVDVAGKVRTPGIVRLPAGSRVVDAVAAAGGARRGVNLSGLNLARILVDGEQVVVGIAAPAGVAASAASAAGVGPPAALVNINVATQAELETLPGIGPVTAQAILQWRTDHGAFTAVDELMEVSGIGAATLADLAPYVTL